MGVDLIKEIGIGGHFLAERHTIKHLRSEQVQSTIIDRSVREEWQATGSNSMIQNANQMAAELIENHRPDPLPEGMLKEIQKIIKHAEQ